MTKPVAYFLFHAGAGRVKENHISLFTSFGHVIDEIPRVSFVKPGIADTVVLRVLHGVFYRIRIQFHADDLSGFFRRAKPDGSDAAVGVDNRFPAGKAGKFQRRPVQPLRLSGIDLEKGSGGQFKGQTAERVLKSFSLSRITKKKPVKF